MKFLAKLKQMQKDVSSACIYFLARTEVQGKQSLFCAINFQKKNLQNNASMQSHLEIIESATLKGQDA